MNKLFKTTLISILSLSLFCDYIHAVPAIPTPITVAQPDGSELTILLRGDENFSYRTTLDGYLIEEGQNGFYYYATIINNDIVKSEVRATDMKKRKGAEISFLEEISQQEIADILSRDRVKNLSRLKVKRNTKKLGGFPTSGKVKSLVILVEFNDKTFTVENPQKAFSDLLNEMGYSRNGATGSSKDYFIHNSQGQFEPEFDVFGPVKLPQNMSYYGENSNSGSRGSDKNPAQMIVDACNLMKDSIDFSDYDLDNDGDVDNVYVFYAGYGEADGGPANSIWPHKWYVYDGARITLRLNGVRINDYACSSELINGRGNTMCGIGTFTHEFSHVLGLPDLYQTAGTTIAFTPGSWSILDMGPYNNNQRTPPNYSAYERYALGWLDPVELDQTPANITVDPLQNNIGYIIKTLKDTEYYILENRQQQDWDTYLPGHGMLIWHIDYNEPLWQNNTVNNRADHQYVDLEEADNKKTEGTRAGDAFPGTANIKSFTDDTTPGMKTWTGLSLDMPITNIAEDSGKIYFQINGGIPLNGPVKAKEAKNPAQTSFIAQWEPIEGATSYILNVYTYAADMQTISIDEYTNKDVGNVLSFKVTGLEPENEYAYTVIAKNIFTQTDISNEIIVRTSDATFDFMIPKALPASNVIKNAFTANWEALDGAQKYYIDVYEKTIEGELKEQSLNFIDRDLPFGWTTNATSSYFSEGYYGKEAPSIRLNLDADYIESPIYTEEIRRLSFWYRGANLTGINSIVLQGFNGDKWVVLDTISPLSEDSQTLSFNIYPFIGMYAVKIIYQKDGSGAVAVDDMDISYGGLLNTTYLISDKDVGNILSFEVTGLEDGKTYWYSVRAHNGTYLSRESNEIIVLTKPSVSINDINGDADKVYTYNNSIIIETGDKTKNLKLYTIEGNMLLNTEVLGKYTIPASQKGIYLVVLDSKVYKILLR